MKRRETTINGRSYSLLLPPVREAMPLCTRTAVLLGPLAGMLGAEARAEGLAAFSRAIQGVDPTKADQLMMDAVRASHLSFQGGPISAEVLFEKHFGEHREDAYPVILWALWECVRDFFPQGVFAALTQKAMEKMAASPSPTDGAKTGGSAAPSGRGTAPGSS